MEMVKVKSSNIDKVGYQDNNLYIEFKGKPGKENTIYCFYDVPVKIYEELMAAISLGSYFSQYIKNEYPSGRIDYKDFYNFKDLYKGEITITTPKKEYIRYCVKCGADQQFIKVKWVPEKIVPEQKLKNEVVFKPEEKISEHLECNCNVCGYSWETITNEQAVKQETLK